MQKIFNNTIFRYQGTYRGKKEAQAVARELRGENKLVRIIKADETGYFDIYMSAKGRKRKSTTN